MVSPWVAQPGMAGTSAQKPPSSASCTTTLIFMSMLWSVQYARLSAWPTSFPPTHPVPPLPALPRIEFFALEASHELLRIRRGGEAVDVEPLPVVTDAMAARA